MDPKITEQLAGNLNELSLDEREHVLEDIHGCCVRKTSKEEEPSFVERCLQSLENEIGKIKGTSREAYDLAIRMDQKYVQDRNFRLKFLRADEFVIHNAAKRMVTHFESKLRLFGKEKLVKDITHDDLSCEDQRVLCSGSFQFTGARDSTGRPINFNFPELNLPTCSFESWARTRWYLCMIPFEEESTQLTDVVLEKRFQLRTRIHAEDSYLSSLSTLQSFGINREIVPIGDDGRPQKVSFLQFLDSRISFERKSKSDSLMDKSNNNQEDADKQSIKKESIMIPTCKDVLLGRSKLSSHPGNVVFEKIIDIELIRYQQDSSKFEKTCIVIAIMDRIKASGGRFLNQKKGSKEWHVTADNEVRESVTAKFRYRAKTKNK